MFKQHNLFLAAMRYLKNLKNSLFRKTCVSGPGSRFDKTISRYAYLTL